MEAVKLFDKKKARLDWEYDGKAETLYISFGKPRPAVGVDVGEGVVVRYDEEVVGLNSHRRWEGDLSNISKRTLE